MELVKLTAAAVVRRVLGRLSVPWAMKVQLSLKPLLLSALVIGWLVPKMM